MNSQVILPWLLWLVLVIGMVVAGLTLSGCSATFTGTCAIRPVGMTDSGVAVVQAHCERVE